MSADRFFPRRPNSRPTIYAYEDTNPQYRGLLKIGYTTVDAKSRVAQQYPTLRPGKPPYRIVLEESAMRNDGTTFIDHDVHRHLRIVGVKNPEGEWFKCSVAQVKAAIIALKTGEMNEESRSLDFKMRPEQVAAVEKTIAYFKSFGDENSGKPSHFLWNAKMRFGKTFAAYQLAKKMGWRKMLVLTFKPAVQGAWEEDLKCHIDFKGWQFISPGGMSYEEADKKKPFVCFGSFQDYLGKNKSTGGIKTKNEWVHATNWDCVILDEYHYGAWRENAKELFEAEDKNEIEFGEGQGIEDFDEEIMPITTGGYLYLSGTPFRAIASGEFIEEQIFNWTYSDEQQARQDWAGADNPYAALPRMVLMTYQLPDSIREIAMQGEFDEFDLNVFFTAAGVGDDAKFTYQDEVQKWLDLIRGSFMATTVDNLKLGAQKPPMPFSDARLLNVLSHTFWFLPSVASCQAMRNLLAKKQNRFYHDFKVIVAAGSAAGTGVAALPPVQEAMDDPLNTKTITLSCGKLTTGVTVRPWTGILMLRNSSTPETYFQSAFRVQSPWTIRNPDSIAPNQEQIIKEECYIFDFAPNRALRQIADYSCRLNVNESNPEKKVEEFISFLPVLAYDGSSMKQVDAAGILDMAMSGTTATMLARRWESALLVNVDNSTLQRLMNNREAMDSLMNIEGFRNLNQDIETIINKSEAVKKAKKEANDEELSDKEKKKLTEEEKEYKNMRKQIQEKLIKFATRVPVFMYLTDYRERCLKDVITQLEPGLFRKVSGLTVKEFELLVSLGVFNSALMNDAVFKFKRYEDASLSYTGINRHEGEDIGLYDTVLSRNDYQTTFVNETVEAYGGTR
ncbi:MAG: GIY-YIG nuclease family protein [Nitrospirae bacterium]|nr:GIY-YIG nuclease family protein [Nitrospirota bacterium]